MIQIFYKDKPIIISDKKSDLKDTLLIDLKIIKERSLLSNKSWDKGIKTLVKNNLIEVIKDNKGLFIKLID